MTADRRALYHRTTLWMVMSYRILVHGRLMREGRAVIGATDVLFRVYAAPTGGEALWEALLPGIECGEGGAFQAEIGAEPPMDVSGIDLMACYLSFQPVVGGREPVILPEIGPRQPLAPLILAARLAALEAQIAALAPVRRRLARLRRMLRQPPAADAALSARVDRIGEELEELVGKDGDIVDLYERVERLEGRGPLAREGARVEERLAEIARRLGIAEQALAPLQVEGGLLRRAGDQMSGPLRAPRLIAEVVEAREVVVEGRPLQIRQIEGRAGAGKKEAALMLNARSGAEVVVGREGGAGARVFGPIRGAHHGIAVERLPAVGLPPDPAGLCVRYGPEGLTLTGRAGDLGLVGVCLRVIEGEAEVLVRGRGAVLARGPIPAGTRLGGGEDGYACPLPEGSLGRALGWAVSAAKNTDQGWSVEVLVSPG